jgi:CRISPR-associated endonuclease Cas3-HD
MTLYADADRRQELFSHLRGVASKAGKCFNADVACKRFNQMGLNATAEGLKRVLERAALLHDIGKAADMYQKRFRTQEGDSKPTFYLHEVPSAVICQRVCNSLGLPKWEVTLCSLLVLQHMSSIRDWLASNREISYSWRFADCRTELEEFIRGSFNISVNFDVDTGEAKEFLHNSARIIRDKNYRWLKLYTLLLGPLTAADSIDAYEARREDLTMQRRWFVEELMNLEEH